MSSEGRESLPKRMLNFTRLTIDRLLPQQLKNADLNPHEGKLRASGMPESEVGKVWKIPDAPPLHDDTLPKKDKP